PHIHVESVTRGGFMRIGGTVGSANTAAAYFSILLSAAVSLLFTNLGRAHKWLAGAVLGFGGIALILTFSRGGWIALVVSMILFGLRSEEHTSELQSRGHLVCRLLLEKKKKEIDLL